MSFQIGNTLGAKTRVVDGMIRSVLATDDRGRLRKAIETTLDKAADGCLASLDWLTCRLEGKPKGDEQDKSQLIQVVINGYRDDRLVIEHTPPTTLGAYDADMGVASREPVDSLPTPEKSEFQTLSISEISQFTLSQQSLTDDPR